MRTLAGIAATAVALAILGVSALLIAQSGHNDREWTRNCLARGGHVNEETHWVATGNSKSYQCVAPDGRVLGTR